MQFRFRCYRIPHTKTAFDTLLSLIVRLRSHAGRESCSIAHTGRTRALRSPRCHRSKIVTVAAYRPSNSAA
jgi:hypothetical protein